MNITGYSGFSSITGKRTYLGPASMSKKIVDVGFESDSPSFNDAYEYLVSEQDSNGLICLYPGLGYRLRLPEATGSGLTVSVLLVDDADFENSGPNADDTDPSSTASQQVQNYTSVPTTGDYAGKVWAYKLISTPKGTYNAELSQATPDNPTGAPRYQGIFVAGNLSGNRTPAGYESNLARRTGTSNRQSNGERITFNFEAWDGNPDSLVNFQGQFANVLDSTTNVQLIQGTSQNTIDKFNTRSIWALQSSYDPFEATPIGPPVPGPPGGVITELGLADTGAGSGSWLTLKDVMWKQPNSTGQAKFLRYPGWIVTDSSIVSDNTQGGGGYDSIFDGGSGYTDDTVYTVSEGTPADRQYRVGVNAGVVTRITIADYGTYQTAYEINKIVTLVGGNNDCEITIQDPVPGFNLIMNPVINGGGSTSSPDLQESRGQPLTFGSEGY